MPALGLGPYLECARGRLHSVRGADIGSFADNLFGEFARLNQLILITV